MLKMVVAVPSPSANDRMESVASPRARDSVRIESVISWERSLRGSRRLGGLIGLLRSSVERSPVRRDSHLEKRTRIANRLA